VVKDETDLGKLILARDHTSEGSEPEAKIEAQIATAVVAIDIGRIPDWFKQQLRNPTFPDWIMTLIRQRSVELLALLNREE